jgi:membrane-bound metal-dependent hydrolase YbcI (DUF457 family)
VFIGHFAVGFAAKRAAPRASLGTLLLAAAFLDVLWPVFVLLGWETVRIVPGITAASPFDFTSYPISHSLLLSLVWGALFGWLYLARRHDPRGAVVLGAAVVSHWVLDWISHRPDMPLWPGGPRVGLGLWNSIPATAVVEGAMFVLAVWIYLRATRARNRIGLISLWAMLLLLAFLYVGNIVGPPPPSARAVAVVGLIALAIFTPWGYWIDRNRESTVASRAASG